jgi:hypothetical protein
LDAARPTFPPLGGRPERILAVRLVFFLVGRLAALRERRREESTRDRG